MAVVALLLVFIASCERKAETTTAVPTVEAQPPVARTSTAETDELRDAIDRFIVAPTTEGAAEVQRSFAELDLEIAELQEDVVKEDDTQEKAEAEVKRRNLVQYRDAERKRFTEAQVTAGVPVLEPKKEDLGHEIKEELKDTGEKIKDTLEDVVR